MLFVEIGIVILNSSPKLKEICSELLVLADGTCEQQQTNNR